jgi:hypothetical protein
MFLCFRAALNCSGRTNAKRPGQHNARSRVSTQALFDLLEVPQRKRTAGACRRLACLMREELGWVAMKVRAVTQGGFKDKVRGYARDARRVYPTAERN